MKLMINKMEIPMVIRTKMRIGIKERSMVEVSWDMLMMKGTATAKIKIVKTLSTPIMVYSALGLGLSSR